MGLSRMSEKGPDIVYGLYREAGRNGSLNMAGEYSSLKAPPALLNLCIKYLKQQPQSYAPVEGILSLRKAIAGLVEHWYTSRYDPESEITITAGATQAIYTAISAFLNDEDEAIIFEPAYEIYAPSVLSCRAHPVYIHLKKPDYRIDWEEVQKCITSRTKIIIINTPNNPAGSILTAFDMEKLQKIVYGTRIIVVSDEVFEHIVFEGIEHQSVARFPQLAERSLIISSFGKSLNITGWKVGYCLAPEKLMQHFRRKHQFIVQSVNAPVQHALADYISDPAIFKGIHNTYQEKQRRLIRNLAPSRLKILPAMGSFFQLLDFSNISDQSDVDFALYLIKKYKITLLPLSVYYHDYAATSQLKCCFARDDEMLDELSEILIRL